jgi:hypothetical protein
MEEYPKILILDIKTFSNDFGGIYDYSSKSVKSITDNILDSTYVIRDKNNNFKNINQHSDIPKESDLLFHVLNDSQNIFFLINPIPRKLKLTRDNLAYINNKIWYVINSEDNLENGNNNPPYYINVNDIMKLGKVKFNISKIFIKNSNIENDPPMPINDLLRYDISKLNQNTPPVFPEIFEAISYSKNNEDKNDNHEQTIDGTPSAELPEEQKKSEKKNQNFKCIICKKETFKNYSETDDGESGNLISLCNCREEGLVHLGCLRKQLKVNCQEKGIDKEITIENIECPICKEQYPLKFKYKNENDSKIKNLIEEYKEPEDEDYMVLESLDYYIDEKICKTIHIIKLTNENISIGRDPENDLIEKDISISRFHAVLKYNKMTSKISIVNKSKKFGTLVLIKKPLKILDEKIHLQVGRSYIVGKLEEKNKILQHYI